MVWRREFRAPYVLRAEIKDIPATTLTSIRMFARNGGTHDEQEARLTDREGERLEATVRSADICKMRQSGQFGIDGSYWMVEFIDNEDYCLIAGWSPDEGTPLGDLGRTLIELSGRDIPEQDIY